MGIKVCGLCANVARGTLVPANYGYAMVLRSNRVPVRPLVIEPEDLEPKLKVIPPAPETCSECGQPHTHFWEPCSYDEAAAAFLPVRRPTR